MGTSETRRQLRNGACHERGGNRKNSDWSLISLDKKASEHGGVDSESGYLRIKVRDWSGLSGKEPKQTRKNLKNSGGQGQRKKMEEKKRLNKAGKKDFPGKGISLN